jgi:D-serine deaminase-like pyridoxal phosphate-dependent protein
VAVHISELTTPAAVIDRDILDRNCRTMSERMRGLGVRLRPHVKSHKTVEIARRQVAGHAAGVTVSTLPEARAMAEAGLIDITWAVPVPHPRIHEAVTLHRELSSRGGQLQVLVDHPVAVDALEAESRLQQAILPVLLKVDCGYGRAGVDPGGEEGPRLAHRIHRSQALSFRGVLTHGGHSYDARNRDEIASVAAQERHAVVGFAERLRADGLPVDEVSLGSTPTMAVATDLAGVTEARPGNYALFDVFQARIGSCELAEVALSVLVSVIGVYPSRGQLLVDGGALAFSKDPGAEHVDPGGGFGVVLGMHGGVLPLKLASLSQEHGKMTVLGDPAWLGGVSPGDRLRVLPNHCCLVTALHPTLQVVAGGEVVDSWTPVRGW